MTSAHTPAWKRLLHTLTPSLFQKCGGGNYHWRWHRLCFCRRHEYEGLEWNGGIQDLKTGDEYVPLRLAIQPFTHEQQMLPDTVSTQMPEGWRWF